MLLVVLLGAVAPWRENFEVLGKWVDWLEAPQQTGLRRAFVTGIRRILLPYRAPGMELPEFNDLQDLHEVHDMLAERIKKWPGQWMEKGREEGRVEGRQEGRHEGVEGTLRKLVTLKFGPLPDWADERLSAADDAQLEAWVSRILEAGTLEALFKGQ